MFKSRVHLPAAWWVRFGIRLAIVVTAVVFGWTGAGGAGAQELKGREPEGQQSRQIQRPEDQELFEMDLEQLMEIEFTTVFGASRYAQLTSEAPAAVTIITSEDIDTYGWRTLADILKSVAGAYGTYDRNYHYAGIRGFGRPGDYNTRLLVLLNGRRMNDAIYGASSMGRELLVDVDTIEQVEIIRGPSSSVYGTNAFFGVINIITKNGRTVDASEVSGDVLSSESYKARLSYGTSLENGLDLFASGSLYSSQGTNLYFPEFDDPETNNGFVINGDGERHHNFFALASYGRFSVEGSYVSRDKGVPTAAWGTVFNDPRTETWDSQKMLDIKYDRPISDASTGLLARVYINDYDFTGDYAYDYADEEDEEPYVVVNRDRDDAENVGAELKHIRHLGESHLLMVGGELIYNYKQFQTNYDEEVYFRADNTSTVVGFYAQDEMRLGDRWLINAGLRYDHYDTFGGTTNPRLAVIWKPRPRTTLKGIYGSAFRAPSAYELHYHDGWSTKPAGHLEPERTHTAEAVLEQLVGQNMRATVSGFYYGIENLIDYVMDPEDELLFFVNQNAVRASGIEAELEGRWSSGIEVRTSYSYQRATDKDTGDRLSNSPAHLGKLNLRYPFVGGRLVAGLELQLTSERKTVYADHIVNGFPMSNLTLRSPNLYRGLDLSFSVYNLFDEEYWDPGSTEHIQPGILQDGRCYRLRLTYGF